MPKDAVIRARLSSGLLERLDRVLARKGLTRTDWIISQIAQYLDEEGRAVITVINPWSHEVVEIAEEDVTQAKLDAMAERMDDEIRELVHRELSPCSPGEFFRRYVELAGAEAGGVLWFS